MQVPSNVLAAFRSHAGTMIPDDGIIIVPNELQLTAEVPTPLLIFPPNVTTSPNTSFVTNATVFRSNAGAALATGIATLSAGVWKIRALCAFGSNWSDTGGTFSGLNFSLLPTPLTFLIALASFPTVLGYGSVDIERTLVLTSPLTLFIDTPGNGAGQIHSLSVCVSCERIL